MKKMKRLIIFLIRKRLGLKRNEHFRFINQKSSRDYYFFTYDSLIKMEWHTHRYCEAGGWWQSEQSNCSLNWLLDDRCVVEKVEEE